MQENYNKYVTKLLMSTLLGSLGISGVLLLIVLSVIPVFFLGTTNSFEEDYNYKKYNDVFDMNKDQFNVGIDITLLMALERIKPSVDNFDATYSVSELKELANQMISEYKESYTLEYTDSFFDSSEFISTEIPSDTSTTKTEDLSHSSEQNGVKRDMNGTKNTTTNLQFELLATETILDCSGVDCIEIEQYKLRKETTVETTFIEHWEVTYYKYDEAKFMMYVEDSLELTEDELDMLGEMSSINKELTGFTNQGLIPWFMSTSPIESKPLETLNMRSGFGYRLDPFTKDLKFHKGVDFPLSVGSKIYATNDGEIVNVGYDDISGNYYVIKHKYKGHEFYSLGAHCSDVLVEVGDEVKTGDVVAKVGSTGKSTGPHLHIEYHYYDENEKVYIDPELLFVNFD